jgi:riboflavin kinase / FMN adenylyltransferase
MGFIRVDSPQEWRERFSTGDSASVVTVGNFDGVHLGHQKILRSVVERAEESHSLPAVLTFFPHPARILRPNQAPALLATLDQRLAAFAAAGIEAALVLKFDRELAQVPADVFVQRYLVDTTRARAVLVGGNFRFGHKQAGDINLLRELGKRWNFDVEVVPPVTVGGIVVSSTAVRDAVREGRVDDARKLLGRPYALSGEIRAGTGLGRKVVVPTLNLATEQELLPQMGVYATEVLLDGKVYRAATNVGVRPTFDGTRTTVESHLLDFNEDRTGGHMEVRFWSRLRDEKKFSGPDVLRDQILKDIEKAREYFHAAQRV